MAEALSSNREVSAGVAAEPAPAGAAPAPVNAPGIDTDSAPARSSRRRWLRAGAVAGACFLVGAVALFAGARYGLLLLLGFGFGVLLEGLGFGFAGPIRRMITRRDPRGLVAQLFAVGLVAVVALPLLAARGGELAGAHAPIGWAMILGAFVFGICMQLVLGCGSGTLVNAGAGDAVGVLALPFFVLGSFLGAYGLQWWVEWGTLPVLTTTGLFGAYGGLVVTLGALGGLALLLRRLAPPELRRVPRRLLLAAGLLAGLALLHLVVAGQPWGVVYGLGLWGAKGAHALGLDLGGSAFWSAPVHAARVEASVLTDVTSLTNIGILLGVVLVGLFRGLDEPFPRMGARGWLTVAVAGFGLGYSARLAFGCNVGAFFSGIGTGSLHGWVWLAAAFAGAWLGLRLRPRLGLEQAG